MAYSKVITDKIIKMKLDGEGSRYIAQVVLGNKSKKSSVNDIYNRYLEENTFITKPRVRVEPEIANTKPRKQKPNEKLETQEIYPIVTSEHVGSNVTHIMIPDTQCKGGIDMSYLSHIGEYLARKQPAVIVHIGDHADMPSLSSYDKGKKSAEGKRVFKDIEASIEGMNLLLKPIYDLQQSQLQEFGRVLYKPKMVLTLGNHEQRIERHVDANPELHGLLSYDNLKYKEFGWEVYDFLEPAIVNGVVYSHFMANPMTGKPYGGAALSILKQVGESFCMGHKQCLDVATRFLPASGKQQWAIIAGAAYPHDEGYKGYQGNKHFRGIVIKHNVINGSFNPMFVDLKYLEDKYHESTINN